MKISTIQLNAAEDKAANLAKIEKLVDACMAADQPDVIVLPESSAICSPDPAFMRSQAEPIDGPFAKAISRLAARHNIILHAGSMMESHGGQFYNTAILFARSGELIGKYRKIHRYDAVLSDGSAFRESDFVDRGDEVVVVDVEGYKIGLAICYDLRFSRLFDQLSQRGASIVLLPAAFNFHTGAAHWEVLVRARAIEFQYYIVAADQIGTFGRDGHMFFGHSMIVDPWGNIIAQVSSHEGWSTAIVDTAFLESVRTRLPVRDHQVLP